MFTDNDRRELERLMQKRRRASPTGTRRAMLAWSNGEKGKAAKQKWYANGGAELEAERRAPGTQRYEDDKERDRESIAKAEKHNHEWTAKEEESLLEMHAQGKTTKEIAAALSRSFRGVERKRERLKASNTRSEARPEAVAWNDGFGGTNTTENEDERQRIISRSNPRSCGDKRVPWP